MFSYCFLHVFYTYFIAIRSLTIKVREGFKKKIKNNYGKFHIGS